MRVAVSVGSGRLVFLTFNYVVGVAISVRPLAHGDVPAWVDLLAAIERVDGTGEHFAAADLAEEMANPEVEVGKDFVGAFEPCGQLIGYFSVLPLGVAEGN